MTGGIEGKLKTAINIVNKHNIPVYIVQVGTEHVLEAISGREPKVGTVIRKRKLTQSIDSTRCCV